MAEVFQKQLVRYFGPDGKRCLPGTPGATKAVEHSRKYYGTVARRQIPLCPDKTKSQQMLNKLLTDAAMKSVGLHDPYEEHRKKLLAGHLDDFRRALGAKGNTLDYVKLVMGRLGVLVRGCAWRTLDDLNASQAVDWLAGLRASE